MASKRKLLKPRPKPPSKQLRPKPHPKEPERMTSHKRDDDDKNHNKNNKPEETAKAAREEPEKAAHDAPQAGVGKRGRPASDAEVTEAQRRYDLERGGPPSINEPPPDRPGTQPSNPQRELPMGRQPEVAPAKPPKEHD
jgi:hypothetical protein